MNIEHASVASSEESELNGDRYELPEAIVYLWGYRRFILIIAFLAASVAAYFAVRQVPLYQTSVVLVPIHQRSSLNSGLDILNNLGFGGSESARPGVAEYLAVLRSVAFSTEFVKKHGLENEMKVLYDSGDSEDNEFWFDTEPFSLNKAGRLMSSHISVRDDRKTGLIYINVSWLNKANAADLTNAMVDELNAQIKQEEIRSAVQSSEILETKIEKTSVTAVQQSVGRILEDEIKKEIIAQTEENSTFKIVDRAVAPYKPMPMGRGVRIVQYFVLGMLLSSAFLILLRSIKRIYSSLRSSEDEIFPKQ
jgi:LPS O-antigen subunit length determinant protein (WzzB/FepE family)